MTVTRNGVRLTRRSNRWWRLAFILAAEGILSAFVYMSLAAHVLWPEDSKAAAGVSAMLSYEGRLMDASGNPLGGTGTPYCFRYSIYDAASGGTKLWPAGTPNTSLATSTDGVFSSLIGQADALTYNFFDSDTVYLNVDVYTVAASGGTCSGGSWETLSPRQQIASTGYAQTAKNTYGGSIQVGDGVNGTLNFLALDVKNTDDYIGQSCTTSGTLWYNSAISKTLVCENSVIQAISNASATTTIAGITTNTAAAASTGTIVFSNANGVTFGINGQTITASVAAAGGAGSVYSTVIGKQNAFAQSSSTLGQNSLYIYPEVINQNIIASALKVPVMITASSNTSASRQVGYTANFGVYTRNATNSTVLSLHYSTSYTAAMSWNSNASVAFSGISAIGNSTSYNSFTSSSAGLNVSSVVHGAREFIMPFNTTLAPGEYWFAFRNSSSSAGGAIASAFSVSNIIGSSQTQAPFSQATSATSAGGIGKNIGLGTYSATTAAFPSGISMTQINKAATWPIAYIVSATS